MPASQKVFVVDRAKWLNSHSRVRYFESFSQEVVERELDASLLDSHSGAMCCLGFVCQQLGVPKKALTDVGMPEMLGTHHHKLDDILLDGASATNTQLAKEAVRINDDSGIEPKAKEKQLKALFRAEGYTLKFEGKAPKVFDLTKKRSQK